MERAFLGWDGPLLERAAEWLLERRGNDLGRVLVALPGGRAVRALREALARRAPPGWTPPRILTQGDLTDELVVLDRPAAGRLARTLAWARALREIPGERLLGLLARPPEAGHAAGWLRLAETVRAVHAELALEGLAFADVARRGAPSTGEARRFEVLADAQERWRRLLDRCGLDDPHESRFAAIEAGRIDPDREVVLVGVADMNRLLRRLVERLGKRATALVFAPREEASAFDELGCLRADAWRDRDLDLPGERWQVADGPEDQAARAVAILAGFGGALAPEEISIGVCDEEVAPYLERRLAEDGIGARHAAGTPIERTRPFRMLADLAAWLAGRGFPAYAALLRHPDLEASLRGALEFDVPAALDGFHGEHLPAVVDGDLPGKRGEDVHRVHAALLARLGDLASRESRPLAEWPDAVRRFLLETYPGALDPSVESQRVLAGALSDLSDALGEIERLPAGFARLPATAAEALDLVATMTRGGSVPPEPPAASEASVELLGWLELPLDEAPVLVVTGFQEGFVPRSRRDDPFLPDGLRRKLGLPSADDRVARDVYAATVLLRSKREVAFVSGRKNGAGDPLKPSRLVFHVKRAAVLARVGLLRRAERWPDPARLKGGARHELPRVEPLPPVARMRVTAFRDYLRWPYGFYLRHVLGLETTDDAAREMDARAFGRFAHEALQDFGASDRRDATDAREIERWLRAKVEDLGRRRYGAEPLPAVRLQLAQVERRLAFFARAQAERAREGWTVRRVEWTPASPVALPMGEGEAPMPLLGTIDRIDVNERTGEWAILDYKTGFAPADPGRAHRSGGAWRDLQLPLYTLLARELGLPGEPALGYFKISKDRAETRVAIAEWGRAELDDALEAAREVVRAIRDGRYFDRVGTLPDEPILLAIAGRGLVETTDEGDAGSEGAEEAG